MLNIFLKFLVFIKDKQLFNLNNSIKEDKEVFVVDGDGCDSKVKEKNSKGFSDEDFSNITIKDIISLLKKINSGRDKGFEKDLNFKLELRKKKFNDFKIYIFFIILRFFENSNLLKFNSLRKVWLFICEFFCDINIFFFVILSFLFFLLFL